VHATWDFFDVNAGIGGQYWHESNPFCWLGKTRKGERKLREGSCGLRLRGIIPRQAVRTSTPIPSAGLIIFQDAQRVFSTGTAIKGNSVSFFATAKGGQAKTGNFF
jgi:hypothetical protein